MSQHKFPVIPQVLLMFGWTLASHGETLPRSFEKRLSSGDAAALMEVREMQSLDQLYQVLLLALLHQFCPGRENCGQGDNSEIIAAAAQAAISRIPDHAKQLGDDIDQSSQQPGKLGQRENGFYLLSKLRTPQAIAQIGRFLIDERNPEAVLGPDSGLYAVPNSYRAAESLSVALGNTMLGTYGHEEVKAMQTWWLSPAAEVYRTPPETEKAIPKAKVSKINDNKRHNIHGTAHDSWSAWILAIVVAPVLAFLAWRMWRR